jgi:predicted RNA methylase
MKFYHDFSALGLSLPQRGGIYPANQAAKAPVITRYLAHAVDTLKREGIEPLTVAELFCADAYYSFLAAKMGADRCDAFDSDRDGHMVEARYVKEALQAERVTLHDKDVLDIPPDFSASIVMNTGGLYHVADPMRVLDASCAMARRFLIVQTVVSLAHESDRYFEAPAPGWQHGCRFSAAFLDREIIERGLRVIMREQNILSGNDRPEDRGSVYFLIER